MTVKFSSSVWGLEIIQNTKRKHDLLDSLVREVAAQNKKKNPRPLLIQQRAEDRAEDQSDGNDAGDGQVISDTDSFKEDIVAIPAPVRPALE